MQEETPQLEDGYTRLANELFDAILAYPFSARQLKVLLTVIRKTYGYNKKRDDMSASQISNVCGLARPHVVKTLGELAEMKVIFKQSGKFGTVVEVNKRYKDWGDTKTVSRDTESVPRDTKSVHVPNQYSSSTESVSELVPNRYTQKTTPKDNQQKTTHTPSRAAQISMAMRKHTISSNPAHPVILKMAEQDVAIETIEACCKEAREAKPNEQISPAYIAKKLEGWIEAAKNVNVAGAQKPGAAKPKFDDWYRSDAGISRKAAELGIQARGGESYAGLRERCESEIRRRQGATA